MTLMFRRVPWRTPPKGGVSTQPKKFGRRIAKERHVRSHNGFEREQARPPTLTVSVSVASMAAGFKHTQAFSSGASPLCLNALRSRHLSAHHTAVGWMFRIRILAGIT
jgi:hypothetical protein